ncbi:MAG: PAS domain S-box protein [Deltaproteobacteria bacterium]|nr:PAS domain S-box protein [Deltaproteobacteria bacterium]
MRDEDRKKSQLIEELAELRRIVRHHEKSESEQRWVRNVLSQTEQHLHSIIGGSPIPAFVIGKDHRLIYWNRALEELSKIKAADVIGTSQQWRAFYKTMRPCMADLLVDEALGAIPKWYEGKYIQSNLLDEAYEATDFFPELGNRGKWLRFTAAVIRNAEGQLIGAIETLEDITERKLAEEALLKAHQMLEARVRERTLELAKTNEVLQMELGERQRAEEVLRQTKDHLSLILESLPIVSYTRQASDPFEITFVSNTIEEITGYTTQQFLEYPPFWKDHIHPDDRAGVLAELRKRAGKGTHRFVYRFRSADDAYKWFSDYWRLIKLPDNSTHHIVGAWQDITEERQIRQEAELRLQQMIQTHKLTALGEVVAGVAHEINNPISFIAYNIPLLEEMWDTVEPVLAGSDFTHPDWERRGIRSDEITGNMREIIHDFKIASNRISRVIASLKEFARSDETARKQSIQVTEVIEGALTIVSAQVMKTVSRIDRKLDGNLPLLPGHFQKLEQVITNLLINAHQAIPPNAKGQVTIRARYVKRLRMVLIEIEDNGKGMNKEVLDHLFDPFFTTRRDHGGTGLGLSISYGLVKEHNGSIGVMSRPGLGSRFTLFLPVDDKSQVVLYPSMLCVDPDAGFLKELQANFVDVTGWSFRKGDSPEKIISYLKEHPEVDILLSEVRLPGMDGWDFLRKVKADFPLLPVILYCAEEKALKRSAGVAIEADGLLRKPFHMEQLQNIILDVGRQRL